MIKDTLFPQAVDLLKKLIATPSLSREEDKTAQILADFIQEKGYTPLRKGNNIWVKSKNFREEKPTILLNSHHDTVKANAGWTLNPYDPIEKEGKLFGLGSNDAGASLVSLLLVFLYLDTLADQNYNLIWAGTAEEEISGANGIASILEDLGKISVGIVGEPTEMQMAIAERGLMVVDGNAPGKAGHAARDEGENAIYKAMRDINWIRVYEFPKVSDLLGEVKMSVTQIEAGYQHNVVPDTCKFVVDVRVNELYSNQEIFEIMQNHTQSELKARSFRLNSSRIDLKHALVQRGLALGLSTYGSPTLSDQALIPFPTLKIGVGKSARSHTADEFIVLSEIAEGIAIYSKLLENLVL